MNCYRHSKTSAVGICMGCGKGLCTHCVLDLGYGLTCIDQCQNAIQIVNKHRIDDYRIFLQALLMASLAFVFALRLLVDSTDGMIVRLLLGILSGGLGIAAITSFILGFRRKRELSTSQIEMGKHTDRRALEQKIFENLNDEQFMRLEEIVKNIESLAKDRGE